MTCVNCETDLTAYTLQAHVEDEDHRVDLSFCSTDCVSEWV